MLRRMGLAVQRRARRLRQNPSSTTNPFYGSVTVRAVSDEPLKLSLDEAIRRGFETNLGLKEAESGEKLFQGEKNEALQEFLPTINLTGGTGVFQHNLAAQGFGPGVLRPVSESVSRRATRQGCR